MTKPSEEEIIKFSHTIIDIANSSDLTYLEIITEYCESIGLELDVAATLLSPSIKSKIKEEAINNNLLKKNPMLTF